MAVGDAILPQVKTTLPVDEAANLLAQPLQPPVNGDSYDEAQIQSRLPSFFDAIQKNIAAAQKERADMLDQANQRAADQQRAQNAADTQSLADAQAKLDQESGAPNPNASTAGDELPQVVSTESRPVPSSAAPQTGPSVVPTSDETVQAQGERRALLDPMDIPGARQTPVTVQHSPAEQARIAAMQEAQQPHHGGALGRLKESAINAAKNVGGLVEDFTLPTPSRVQDIPANARDVLHSATTLPVEALQATPARAWDIESYPRQGLVGPLAPALEKLGVPLGPKPLPGTLGEATQAVAHENPYAGFGMNLAEGTIAFAPLGAAARGLGLSPAIMDAAFAGDSAIQTKPVIDEYLKGEISGKDAARQIALIVGPQAGGIAAGHVPGLLKGVHEGLQAGETAAPAGVETAAPTVKYYHGTTPEAAADIAKNGFTNEHGDVHVTTDPDLAYQFAKRYSDNPSVLEVSVANPEVLGGAGALRTSTAENLKPTRILSAEEAQQPAPAVETAPPTPPTPVETNKPTLLPTRKPPGLRPAEAAAVVPGGETPPPVEPTTPGEAVPPTTPAPVPAETTPPPAEAPTTPAETPPAQPSQNPDLKALTAESEGVLAAQREAAGVKYVPALDATAPEEAALPGPETGKQTALPGLAPGEEKIGLTVKVGEGENGTGTIIRETKQGVTVQLPDGTTKVIPAKSLKPSGGAGAGTPPPPHFAGPDGADQSGPVVPPDVRRLNGLQQINRVVQRVFGGEYDKKPVVKMKTEAGRRLTTETLDSSQTGRILRNIAGQAGTPTVKPNAPAHVIAAIENLSREGKTQTILEAAYQYPEYFNISPEALRLFNRTDAALGRAQGWNTASGLELASQTDPKFFPRVVVDVDGSPVMHASRTTRERHTGDFWDFLNNNNHPVDDFGLSVQHYLESTASARAGRNIVNGFRGLGNFDGKGAAFKRAVPGSAAAEGYSTVPGFSDVRGRNVHDGKMDMVRQDLYESAAAPFSQGLTAGQRALLSPARVIRAINFGLGGPFHMLLENWNAAAVNVKEMPRLLGEETIATFRPEGFKNMVAAETPNIMLEQMGGSQINLGGLTAKSEVGMTRGVPEYEDVLDRLPGVGRAMKAQRELTFDRIVPWIQHRITQGRLNDWMMKNPDAVPRDYAEVMASADPAKMEQMLNQNPQFKGALEDAARHGNHVVGFTENTLSRGERQGIGGAVSTPTITRAIAANVRDAFSGVPMTGNARGTYARSYWRNAAVMATSLAVAGTIAARGGIDEYTDPRHITDKRNVLNPAGSNFLNIVSSSGTRYSLVPSPIRSPLKTLFGGTATATMAAFNGDSPQDILKSGIEAQADDARHFFENRLAAPGRAINEFQQQLRQGESVGTSLKEAGLRSGESDVPLWAQPAAEAVTTGALPGRGALEKGALATVGGTQTAATPYETYNQYLQDNGFPEGTQTRETATNKFHQFIDTDPRAQELKAAYEQHRAETATGASAKSIEIQKDRTDRITQAQKTFEGDSSTSRFLRFRKAVTEIRALEAQRQQDNPLDTSSFGNKTPDQTLLDSWYATYKAAEDPETQQVDPNKLDSLQAAWQQAHPGDYKRLILPNYEAGGLSQAEKMLRKDRDFINSTGYWKLDDSTWKDIQNEIPDITGHFATYADYEKDARNKMVGVAEQAGYTGDQALAMADYLFSKDKIAQGYTQMRAKNRELLEEKIPRLIPVLNKWGYSTTNKIEAGLLAGDQTPDTGAGQ